MQPVQIARYVTHQNLIRPSRQISWQTQRSISEVKTMLWSQIRFTLAELGVANAVPMPQYAEVAQWLSVNNGKGLLLYGNCGRSKTILARYVIPQMLMQLYGKVTHYYDAVNLERYLSEALQWGLVVVDDIGAETQSTFKDIPFARIIDRCEKQGKIVIATSNLTGEQLREFYGDRIFDRICGNMTRILFTGESLRK